jgi:hypothetical protein
MSRFQNLTRAVALLTLGGCGPTSGGNPQYDANTGDALNGHLQEDGGPAPADAAPPDAPLAGDAATPPGGELLLYAHTDTVLYRADPAMQPVTLTRIGTFDCIGGTGQDASMTDVAVDKDGKLFAVSNTAAYPIEITGGTVHCMDTWTLPSGAHFYGLTFAPAGVLAASEMLVGANSAGELWAIGNTGATTQVGTFGNVPANDGHGHTYDSANVGLPWELSGDIVFLTNAGSPVGFATVRDCPEPPYSTNCNAIDTLIEINVPALALGNTSSVTKSVRGQVVKGTGCNDPDTTLGYGSVYGIAAWNAKVYGFSRLRSGETLTGGNLVEISNVDGTACLVENYANDKFAGAGVTTLAPVIPVPD